MSDQRHLDAVALTRVVSNARRESTFEDVVIPYAGPGNPLAMTKLLAATSISFRWTPGDYEYDFHPAPRRRLIVMLDGRLEITVSDGAKRQFGVGDLVEVDDSDGQGHISRSADGAPFRTALINLDDKLVHQRMQPISAPTGSGAPYQRTFDGPSGHTSTDRGAWRYVHEGPSGLVTEELSLKGFQYVLAPGNLDYNWHPAPQRQIVLPLTGGMQIENGDGQQLFVRPGEIYVGEDTDGKGHITRAIENQPRFSIFAHLLESVPIISGT
jgi:hypothetical protein